MSALNPRIRPKRCSVSGGVWHSLSCAARLHGAHDLVEKCMQPFPGWLWLLSFYDCFFHIAVLSWWFVHPVAALLAESRSMSTSCQELPNPKSNMCSSAVFSDTECHADSNCRPHVQPTCHPHHPCLLITQAVEAMPLPLVQLSLRPGNVMEGLNFQHRSTGHVHALCVPNGRIGKQLPAGRCHA